MCHFISAVATKNQLFFGPTDSHSDIIDYHKLREFGVRGVNVVKLELTPVNIRKYPVSEWDFVVDQDLLPDWWDPEVYEKRMRNAIEESGIREAAIKYEKTFNDASVEYEKVVGPARDKYEKTCATAYDDCDEARNVAYGKYTKILDANKGRKLISMRNAAYDKYSKAADTAYAARKKILVYALAVFEETRGPAQEKYNKARGFARYDFEGVRKEMADKAW